MPSKAPAQSPMAEIDYSWLKQLPYEAYGRVYLGAVAGVKKTLYSPEIDHPPEDRGRGTFFFRKKTTEWVLSLDVKTAAELEEVLGVLFDLGVQRFILLADLPPGDTGSSIFLPAPASPGLTPFGFVNHARSFAWGKGAVTVSPEPRSDLARAFVRFFEHHPALETSLLEAPGLAARAGALIPVIHRASDPGNEAAIPLSFGVCTANGACLGDRVVVSAGAELRRGRVLGIGFPGVEDSRKISLKIAVEGPAPGAHRFYRKHEVAEAKAGVCWPLLSDFCAGARARGDDGKELRIAGVFPTGEDVILEDTSGNLLRRSRSSVKPEAGPPAPPDPAALAGRLLEPELRLKDFLVEWSPLSGSAVAPNPWKECANPRLFGHPLTVADDGTIAADCLPDTLYSWNTRGAIDFLRRTNGARTWKDLIAGDAGVYFSASPAATFGYGAMDESGGYAIRAKLRPGVKFKFLDFAPEKLEPPGPPVPPKEGFVLRAFPNPVCAARPIPEANTTVYVHYWNYKSAPGEEFPAGLQEAGLEYVVCSLSVLESWSFGTREFYDELVRDVRRFASADAPASAPSYIRRSEGGGTRPRIFDILSDGHPFTQLHLANVFRRQFTLALRNEGEIFVNPEAGRVSELRRRHFETDKPSWFGPGRQRR